MFFSIIIPLYNRPQEIHELLQSLTEQQYSDFEIIIVEDGSRIQAKDIVQAFADRLDVHYYLTENTGQGFARNYGFGKAKGDFFIVLDSDVIVPPQYLRQVAAGIKAQQLDAFGGPDAAHASFSDMQKAISYSMTSPLTTGGIRGNKKHIGPFHPRSFNMGISRAVWERTKGFRLSRRSEDIEFSIRMIAEGFQVGLIPEAFVYHKRRTDLSQFFRQTYLFGKGRIDIYKIYPKELKWVHALPAVFVVGLVVIAMLTLLNVLTYGGITLFVQIAYLGYAFLSLYTIALFFHALNTTKDLLVALNAVPAAYVQLVAYGSGFIQNYMDKICFQK
ncbi:glycosyltransferase [Sphingobacterium chungjuense]|uniref:glycosyltransferase n=1 Tax=Sphingobacterium chungjuense TaxID=2675553 RepID=UPI00140A55C6|nr:glycosyltransferase [Sphingobacterium chungjuense]